MLKLKIFNMVYHQLMSADQLNLIKSMSDAHLTMCASGIGFYSANLKELSENNQRLIYELFRKKYLKTLFCDKSLSLGINLPISAVIIIDEEIIDDRGNTIPPITDTVSMKTIMQMLARAGRLGTGSYYATAYTYSKENHLVNKLKKYVRGLLDEGICDEKNNILNIKSATV
jgi:replicative superfamily II helicase